MKNVWLKDDTEKLLNKARIKYVKENNSAKVTDDKTIREALRGYVNAKQNENRTVKG